MADNYLDPWAWRSDMSAPQPQPNYLAPTLKPGPEPTGYERVFDKIYGLLGGKPENRSVASALATAFDVGTLGMATGAYDGGKDFAKTGRPNALAMALMPGAKVAGRAAGVAERAAETAVEKGIRAFHGSPYDFEKFDMSKMGSGQGAQMFGKGHYFAESEDVAKHYRDMLAYLSPEDRSIAANYSIEDLKKQAASEPNATYRKNIDHIIAEMQKGRSFGDIVKTWPEYIVTRMFGDDAIRQPGRIYDVRINAAPESFLDWDRPLNQQSPHVQSFARRELAGRGGDDPLSMSGGEFYRSLGDKERAKAAGIPGVRYLDESSRGAGDGTRNYVVFDDSLIEIMRKYGIMPPAALAGAAAYQSNGDGNGG